MYFFCFYSIDKIKYLISNFFKIMKKLVTLIIILNYLFFSSFTSIAQTCDGFYPFKQNSKFTIQNQDGKEKVTSSVSYIISNVSNSGNSVKAVVDFETFDAKNKSIAKGQEDITCTNGVISFGFRNISGLNLEQIQQNPSMKITMEGDQMEIPSNLTVGQTLKDITFRIIAKMEGGVNMNLMNKEFKIKNHKVEAKESVTTTAGTFECFKISSTMELEGMFGKKRETKTIAWYAKGVGMVKSESYNEKGKLESRQLLTKFEK